MRGIDIKVLVDILGCFSSPRYTNEGACVSIITIDINLNFVPHTEIQN